MSASPHHLRPALGSFWLMVLRIREGAREAVNCLEWMPSPSPGLWFTAVMRLPLLPPSDAAPPLPSAIKSIAERGWEESRCYVVKRPECRAGVPHRAPSSHGNGPPVRSPLSNSRVVLGWSLQLQLKRNRQQPKVKRKMGAAWRERGGHAADRRGEESGAGAADGHAEVKENI